MGVDVTQKVEQLVQPILDELNLELVDIEFVKEGKNWFLRVFIDGPEGIGLDDCSTVSEQLSKSLDSTDPIDQAYYLEVSSPGAERPLKKANDIAKAVGKNVHVSTYAPLDGEKVFEGRLLSFDGELLVIEQKVKTQKLEKTIPYDKVAKARLAVLF
ncbi:ribosome maturation factor RimP [Salisediminibacterium beveridgei]|uniref:Ribosome maturation factor RimP n=1 Tax=Salisediminibacterium beveridgei TaxID=632773 RepID=A0A1D7QVW6_9BACI|nr:ribosome maturation factor RimP [Salisediminibacterium beveridgei]AOM83147.1 Ribosome maturation factor rimP [Salisediminibacterium beveridgei]